MKYFLYDIYTMAFAIKLLQITPFHAFTGFVGILGFNIYLFIYLPGHLPHGVSRMVIDYSQILPVINVLLKEDRIRFLQLHPINHPGRRNNL